MIGRVRVAALTALAGAAAGLYQLKHPVAALEAEETRLAHALAAERQALHVLASEWAYLNEPERLAGIAARHLDVAPLDARAMIALDELPRGPAAGLKDAGPEAGRPETAHPGAGR